MAILASVTGWVFPRVAYTSCGEFSWTCPGCGDSWRETIRGLRTLISGSKTTPRLAGYVAIDFTCSSVVTILGPFSFFESSRTDMLLQLNEKHVKHIIIYLLVPSIDSYTLQFFIHYANYKLRIIQYLKFILTCITPSIHFSSIKKSNSWI